MARWTLGESPTLHSPAPPSRRQADHAARAPAQPPRPRAVPQHSPCRGRPGRRFAGGLTLWPGSEVGRVRRTDGSVPARSGEPAEGRGDEAWVYYARNRNTSRPPSHTTSTKAVNSTPGQTSFWCSLTHGPPLVKASGRRRVCAVRCGDGPVPARRGDRRTREGREASSARTSTPAS
jgi:hypothetical protein